MSNERNPTKKLLVPQSTWISLALLIERVEETGPRDKHGRRLFIKIYKDIHLSASILFGSLWEIFAFFFFSPTLSFVFLKNLFYLFKKQQTKTKQKLR